MVKNLSNYETVHLKDIGICADYILTNTSNLKSENGGVLFLDRDGVLIEDHGYVNEISRTYFLDETIDLIRELNANHVPIVIVTNQAGVARGKFTESELISFNLYLLDELKKKGAEINALLYCPSHPEGENIKYRKACLCRKPGTRLIDIGLELCHGLREKSIFIGDSETDRQAASAASIQFLDIIHLTDNHDNVLKKLGVLNEI